jgi:GntR family transcriptional regulator
MLDSRSSKPLYEQIKEYILHNIHTGKFAAHTRIPSERDFAEQFGVSRLTVAKALKDLINEGRLYVQIGKGTFVSDEPIDLELESLTSFTEEMQKRGQDAHSRVLYAQYKVIDPETAKILGVPQGIQVMHMHRVRMANHRPIALEATTVPAALCAGILERHDFSYESLYHVLRTEYDLVMTHAEQSFEARAASAEEARHLDLQEGDPVLAINRVAFTRNNRAIEHVYSVYRGDRYKFRAVLRRL